MRFMGLGILLGLLLGGGIDGCLAFDSWFHCTPAMQHVLSAMGYNYILKWNVQHCDRASTSSYSTG